MNSKVIRLGNLVVEPEQYRACLEGRLLPLTFTQFKLLLLLAERENQVQPYKELAALLGDPETSPREIAVHVSRLRKKLVGSHPFRIMTFIKRGYALMSTQATSRSPMAEEQCSTAEIAS